MNLDYEIERVINSNFFFKVGVKEALEHVIFIKNVNEAFINPSNEAFGNLYEQMNWLPSSITDEDPFYGNIKAPGEILEYRKRITQAALQKTREIDESLFVAGPHNFFNVAKNGMAFAFRQYLLEKSLSLGNCWENVINLYYAGHWPIGYFKNKLFAI